MVAVFKLVKTLALVGFNHITDKLLGVDVENFGVGPVFEQVVPYGVHQMGFAQTDTAVDKQGVVQVAQTAGHMHGGGARHAVGRALDQAVKSQSGVEAGFNPLVWVVVCIVGHIGQRLRHGDHVVDDRRRARLGSGLTRSKR